MLTSPRGPALRFHLFGTPVRIGLTFPVVIVAVPLVLLGERLLRQPAMLAGWLALVTVSVLVHEGGHVVALRAFGFRPEVSLNALGGLTSTQDDGHLSPSRSIIVSLAGPLTAVAFGITVEMALLPIAGRGVEWVRAASWFVNIWWSVFNLIPIMPLDGGHVMRELVGIASRRRGGTIVAVASFMAAIAVGAWWAFGDEHPVLVAVGIVVMFGTNARWFALTERQRTVQEITIAHEQLMRGELAPAIATLLPIAASPAGELINDEAYTTLGWALLHERRFADLGGLDPSRFHPNHRALLCGAVSWYQGDLTHAMSLVGEALADGTVDPPDTYFNRVFGRIGELDRLGQSISLLPVDARMRAGVRLRERVMAAAG